MRNLFPNSSSRLNLDFADGDQVFQKKWLCSHYIIVWFGACKYLRVEWQERVHIIKSKQNLHIHNKSHSPWHTYIRRALLLHDWNMLLSLPINNTLMTNTHEHNHFTTFVDFVRVSQHQKGTKIVSGSGISWAICKSAPWQTTMLESHHSVFYRPDALPDISNNTVYWANFATAEFYGNIHLHNACHWSQNSITYWYQTITRLL